METSCPEPHLPDPETLGWKKIADKKRQLLLMTHDPIPKACRKSSHAHAPLDVQISAAVAGKLNCFVPVFVGANRTMSIYIPVKTLTTNGISDALENMMCLPLMKRMSSS